MEDALVQDFFNISSVESVTATVISEAKPEDLSHQNMNEEWALRRCPCLCLHRRMYMGIKITDV